MNTGPRRAAHPTFNPRWEHIAGNQACLSHLLRDYQDCAESYPGSVWPVQAQRALRGLIHAWHAAREQGLDAIPAGVREPLEHEFRHAVLAGLASVARVPGEPLPGSGCSLARLLLPGAPRLPGDLRVCPRVCLDVQLRHVCRTRPCWENLSGRPSAGRKGTVANS